VILSIYIYVALLTIPPSSLSLLYIDSSTHYPSLLTTPLVYRQLYLVNKQAEPTVVAALLLTTVRDFDHTRDLNRESRRERASSTDGDGGRGRAGSGEYSGHATSSSFFSRLRTRASSAQAAASSAADKAKEKAEDLAREYARAPAPSSHAFELILSDGHISQVRREG
jgi:hypothetical protein